MYDIAIIGAGPAGLSAAINASARNKNAIVLGRDMKTSWIYSAEKVNNYLGMPDISGKQMIEGFYKHAESMGAIIKHGKVLQVLSMGDYFSINFDNDFIDAKTIILATGIEKGKKIIGEKEFLGKGVSYCATCDGMLYRKKDVAVIGYSKEAEEDAAFLSEICSSVTYIPKYKMDSNINDNINIMSCPTDEIIGSEFVEGIKCNDNIINCSGIFIIKEAAPADSLLFGLEMNNNSIAVNRLCETNIQGVFAAGDCTGAPYQVAKAVGEGLTAALQAVKFLNK